MGRKTWFGFATTNHSLRFRSEQRRVGLTGTHTSPTMFLTLSRDSLSSVSCPSLSMVTSQSKTRSSPRLSRSLFSGRIDHAQKREANTRDETPFAPDLELLAAASSHGCRSTPSLLVQPRRASWVRSLPAAVMTSSRSVSKFASVRRGFQRRENALRKRENMHLFFLDDAPRAPGPATRNAATRA